MSALSGAKLHILDQLGLEILWEASSAVLGIIEELTPRFDRAVSAFAEAVAKLPEELTSESIVAAGASVLAEYQTAREAASVIADIDSWVASLTELPAYAGHEPAGALRVLAPSSRGELAELNAHQAHGADSLVAQLGGTFLTAARNGIKFKINDPRESAEILEDIESTPIESKHRHVRI